MWRIAALQSFVTSSLSWEHVGLDAWPLSMGGFECLNYHYPSFNPFFNPFFNPLFNLLFNLIPATRCNSFNSKYSLVGFATMQQIFIGCNKTLAHAKWLLRLITCTNNVGQRNDILLGRSQRAWSRRWTVFSIFSVEKRDTFSIEMENVRERANRQGVLWEVTCITGRRGLHTSKCNSILIAHRRHGRHNAHAHTFGWFLSSKRFKGPGVSGIWILKCCEL